MNDTVDSKALHLNSFITHSSENSHVDSLLDNNDGHFGLVVFPEQSKTVGQLLHFVTTDNMQLSITYAITIHNDPLWQTVVRLQIRYNTYTYNSLGFTI